MDPPRSREAHYVAGPPNFRRLGPCDSVSDLRTSAKLGTPEAFLHLRESCHSEHRRHREAIHLAKDSAPAYTSHLVKDCLPDNLGMIWSKEFCP
ncbi:unnamed protein product [Heligmosomoides polygyrus]|uniref:Uncharacterized protein n=1 Tax=Heligmosomoides polygyrus TaxID=6339 RepID=A0A183FHW6_HELPZ|nr:unnamed protein product [Heligmosomoides polygyrus]